MATARDVRQVLATLPEVDERITWDSSTFRVRNKIFTLVNPSEQKVTVKAVKSEQAALVATDPAIYAVAPYIGRFGWVTIQLAPISAEELEELIVESWRQIAPRRLVASYDSGQSFKE